MGLFLSGLVLPNCFLDDNAFVSFVSVDWQPLLSKALADSDGCISGHLGTPGPNGAGNKLLPSIGETGEFVPENAGLGLNPGVEHASPKDIFSNWREWPIPQKPSECGESGQGGRRALLSTKMAHEVRAGILWLPKNTVFQLFLSRFFNVSGGPGWIRAATRTAC